MPPEEIPPDFAHVVRPHFAQCDGIVVASSGECLGIQAREEQIPRRDFDGAQPEDLSALEPRQSWLVGTLLCPGDDTKAIAAWASTLDPGDVARVRFYYLPDVDLVSALEDWYEAGLPDPATAEVDDWGSFHKVFGMDHANQVYRDVNSHPSWFQK